MGTIHTSSAAAERVHLSQPRKASDVNQLSRAIDEGESVDDMALDSADSLASVERDMGLPDWADLSTDDLAEGEIAPHLHDE